MEIDILNSSRILSAQAESPSLLLEKPPKFSWFSHISHVYRNFIKKFVQFLEKHDYRVTAMILGTLLVEFWHALKAGLTSPMSWKRHFNFYQMNPTELTPEQLKKHPLLLIHGNYHNQSAWMSLAKKLKSYDLGPIYTVNVPNGKITYRDYEIVQKKISEINEHYQRFGIHSVKIHIIGHSRGGCLAHHIAWEALQKGSEEIGKIIKIGSGLSPLDKVHMEDPIFHTRVYEMMGKYDILENHQSKRPASHLKIIDSGHLGLLYSSQTHQSIIDWLI